MQHMNDERIPTINAIAFDSKGAKWFARESGLLKLRN